MNNSQPVLALRRRKHKDTLAACLFLAPTTIAFILFILLPLVIVIYISFTKYNVISPPQLNEFKNWIRLTKDKKFVISLTNSFKFLILLVPMHIIVALLLAMGVNALNNRIAIYTFRTIIYFPTLFAASAVAMAWVFVFDKDFGMLNYFLGLLGISKIPWLESSFWAYPAVMIFSLWKFVGNYFLYLYVAIRGVDKTYLEAAEIDGASSTAKFFRIILPLITPTLFFVLVTNMISAVQIFTEPYLITGGGPGNSTRTLSLYIYEAAYGSQNYGYASAMALVFTAIILVLTLLQFKGSSWVSYDR